jgi:hypothetical protein
MLQNGIGEHHPAYYSLVVGVYALYGRFFKHTNVVGMISEKLVPPELRPLHKIMIELRDEVYAHTEPSHRSELRVRVLYQGHIESGSINRARVFLSSSDLSEDRRALHSNGHDA